MRIYTAVRITRFRIQSPSRKHLTSAGERDPYQQKQCDEQGGNARTRKTSESIIFHNYSWLRSIS